MDQELREYLDKRFRESSEQLQEFRKETAERFERVETDVRHTRVVVESVQVQLQLVAEAVVSSSESQERFRAEVAKEFKEVRATVDLHFSHLDRRVKKLERPQGSRKQPERAGSR